MTSQDINDQCTWNEIVDDLRDEVHTLKEEIARLTQKEPERTWNEIIDGMQTEIDALIEQLNRQPDRKHRVEMVKPYLYQDKHARYLHQLVNTGLSNANGAVPYLLKQFAGEITKEDAMGILLYWMETYNYLAPVTVIEKVYPFRGQHENHGK